jgi:catechol 2,3-dioxygenase
MDSSTARPKASTTARLPADARIGRVRLRVADLERSLAFYRDILGLELGREETNTVTLTAPSGDSPREIIVLEERPGISRRPRRPTTTGLYHVALLVPSRQELGRALIGLSEAGYPLRGTADHAVSESLYLDDPDGNGLEIYADRPRALWPVQDGGVQLTVDPMDVAGVKAAGRESAAGWRGLPAQTVVGHVHLTVSRMEPAVRFYRDVIGFDVMMRIPSLTAVSAGGYHHHLNLNTWAGEGAPADSAQVAGLLAWELTVPGDQDRRALIDRLAAAGALIESSGGALAADPDRIPIEIAGVA